MKLEDVWRFPVELGAGDDLEAFREQMALALDHMPRYSPTAILLRIRLTIGRALRWDRGEAEPRRMTLRNRYAFAEGIDPSIGHDDQAGAFSLVYRLDDEYLGEIENRTVLAALHLGRIRLDEQRSAVQLAIYTLPKGRFGRMYMAVIRPFRLWIVYPAIMRAVAARWESYIAGAAEAS